jgi:hypothetical protein
LAGETLSQDKRPPIVYLRSFDADDKAEPDEHVLAKILQETGPFIAIGRPGDTLPPFGGASRFYVEDENWRQVVADLLDRAALVVLRAGKTEGLSWEVSQCRARLSTGKLAILVPSDKSEYLSFGQSVLKAGLKMDLPDYPAKTMARFKASNLAGILYFDRHWRGHIEEFKRAYFGGNNYEFASKDSRAEERFRIALQPVAQQSGLMIAPPRTNFVAMTALFYLGLVLLVFAGMGYLIWIGYLE